jgi:phosphatidylserine/phosphatidylglycerophosphate/cardiolipin synthase-like enzyme
VKQLDAAMDWLANGLQNAIPDFLKGSKQIEGAIYHLTDKRWVIPKLKTAGGSRSIVYFWKDPSKKGTGGDTVNQYAVNILKRAGYSVHKRTKAAIMHDKFLVRATNGRPSAVLMGSANFTPEGLTSQANLLHTFESAALAKLYAARQKALESDPTIANLSKTTGWSPQINVGGAKVRAFFPPEPNNSRVSIDTVTKAVKSAKGSVIFCMFSPTDAPLLKAMLDSGDQGKIMFGLLNSISDPSQSKKRLAAIANGEDPGQLSASAQIQVDIYHRSRRDHKVVAYNYYSRETAPAGFLPEFSSLDTSKWSVVPRPKPPKKGAKKPFIPAVHIHHKFILIDGHTKTPTLFTGSANMSNNSTHRNDENLLEITQAPELAQVYLAEFLRLYEHYRARAIWNETHTASGKTKGKKKSGVSSAHEALTLRTSRDKWVRGAYRRGTPEYLARTELATPI